MSQTDLAAAALALLGDFRLDPASSLSPEIQQALALARALQKRAHELQTPEERKQQTELDRMIQNPSDKATLTAMTDQAFRSRNAARSADQLVHILDVQGVPRFFSPLERTLLHGFQSFGDYLPGVTIPLVKEKMRRETANVIIPAETDVLCQHLALRRQESVRMNVNFLGEAILGEQESRRRLDQYLAALRLPEIEVVSVKISTIDSQISTLARTHTIDQLCDRMCLLYKAASQGTFVRSDGSIVPKFVYLDMEEYRDLSLTAEVFMRTLDRPDLLQVAAGIALQAYVPDSFAWQRRLTEWATTRLAAGGAPVTIRLVKGANMEMERVEASTAQWPQAPFRLKVETDSNYKRMLQYGLARHHGDAVRLGIASHNLFDISYALVLATQHESLANVQFEMLEGMANHQRRALHELTCSLLLYAPACRKEDFIHAIGYLVRRLDENTGAENFLRHAFHITVGSEAWKRLEKGFVDSFELIETLTDQPRRKQNRATETFEVPRPSSAWQTFQNEPDTDFCLPPNSEWARATLEDWSQRHGERAAIIPLTIAGRVIQEPRESVRSIDPSRPGVVVAKYEQATLTDIEEAVHRAQSDPDNWRVVDPDQRHQILRAVAMEIRKARADLIGAAAAEGGKTVAESDPEVSEAIDFVEFYSASAKDFESMSDVTVKPRGVVVVVSPWNFPIAIPCGGIAAALATGNSVILKPASHTVLVAQRVCECFHRAGVPRSALQLIPCEGRTAGAALVAHRGVDTVILTGGTDTALKMLQAKPEMRLLAETGGKNATIVTAMADRDQAIKHVIHSAFGHAGQKCSATSLLLLEDEVFEDAGFQAALVDAARSLRVGSVWEPQNRIGPLIAPPAGDLMRGLSQLEPGESWALQPARVNGCDQHWTAGIKWNVSRGSYTHLTEFFGPLLGVMRFRNLQEAIEIVNETGYGLTSGLESLDDREQTIWLGGIRAGNLYVNRSTTGAIVLRQPFGGMGKSAVGPGIKAGGPNYVVPLMQLTSPEVVSPVSTLGLREIPPIENPLIENPWLRQLADDLRQVSVVSNGETDLIVKAIASFDQQASREFLRQHDHFELIGQDNFRRYLPIVPICIRVDPRDTWPEIVLRAAAAKSLGCRSIISATEDVHPKWIQLLHDLTESWAGDIEFIRQSDDELAESIEWGGLARLRYASSRRVPQSIRRAVIGNYVHIADAPVLPVGRIELLWYLQEQSISIDYHRYGNLGSRSTEARQPTK